MNGCRQAGRAAVSCVGPYILQGRLKLRHFQLLPEGMWEEGSQEWVSAVLEVVQDRGPVHNYCAETFSAYWGSTEQDLPKGNALAAAAGEGP